MWSQPFETASCIFNDNDAWHVYAQSYVTVSVLKSSLLKDKTISYLRHTFLSHTGYVEAECGGVWMRGSVEV